MPDVFTHLMLGLSIVILWKPKFREEGVLLILGSLLIDIERPISLIMLAFEVDWALTSGFHSLIGALCLAYCAALVIEVEEIKLKRRFVIVLIGCIVHLLADLTMYTWEERGFYLLYPLKIPFSFHIVWSGFLWFPVIGILAVVVALLIRIILNKTALKSNEL
ncbi:MAG: metal-dependent hydrolase [Candidatus Kariarchaeaceae archaeon]